MEKLALNLSLIKLSGLSSTDKKLRGCFRPSPDLSVVSLSKLIRYEKLKNENELINKISYDGTSFSTEPWNYFVSFEKSLIYNRSLIPSNVKVEHTPLSHPCHFSIVPAAFDYNAYLNNNMTSNMFFNLKSLYQVFETIIDNGKLHSSLS